MTTDVKEDIGSENGFSKEERESLEEKKLELKSSLSLKVEKTVIETKSSTEILTELFSAFNAEPPVIDEVCGDGEKTVRTNKKNTVSRRSSDSGDEDSAGDKVKEKKGEKKKKEKKKKHKHKSSKHRHSSKKESDSSGINRLHRSREKDKDDIATYSKIKEKILKASASKSKSSCEQYSVLAKEDSSRQFRDQCEPAVISTDISQIIAIPESITEAAHTSHCKYDQSRNCLHESSRLTDLAGTEALEDIDSLNVGGSMLCVTSNDDVVSAIEVGVIPLPEDCASQEINFSAMVVNDSTKLNLKEEAIDGGEVVQNRTEEPSLKSDRLVRKDGKLNQSKDTDCYSCDKVDSVNILVHEKIEASSAQVIPKQLETPASSDISAAEKLDSTTSERMDQSTNEKTESGKNVKSSISVSDSKAKSKIKIKNLKFSTVFQQTLKEAEEQARKKEEEEQVKHNSECENLTKTECSESKPKANETENGDATDQDYINDHSIANEFKLVESISPPCIFDAKESKDDKEKEVNESESKEEEVSRSTKLENGDKQCSKKEQETSEEDDELKKDRAEKTDEAISKKGAESRSTGKSKVKEKKKRRRSRSKSREKSKKRKRSKSPAKAKSRSRSSSVSKSKKRKRSRSRSESKSKRKKRSRSRSKGGKSSGSKANKKSRSKHRKKSRSKSKERKKSRSSSESIGKDVKKSRSVSKERKSERKKSKHESKERKSHSKERKGERKERKTESKERKSDSKERKSLSKERKSVSKESESVSKERKSVSKERESVSKERKSRSKSKGRNRSHCKGSESRCEKRSESREKSRSVSKETKRSCSKEKRKSSSKERRKRSRSRKQSKRRSRSCSKESRSRSRRRSRSRSRKRSGSRKKSRSESRKRSRSRKKSRSRSRKKSRSRSRKKSRSVSRRSRSHSKKRSSSRGRKRSHSRSRRKSRSESRKESSSRNRKRSHSRSYRKSRSQSRRSRSKSRRKSRSRSRGSGSRRSRSHKRSQSLTKCWRSRSDRESRDRSKRSSSRKRSRSRRKSRSHSKKRSRSHSKIRSKSDERSSSRTRKRSRGSTHDKEKDSRRSKTVEKTKLAAAGGTESTGPSSITSGDGGKNGEGDEEKLDKARLLEIARKNAVNLLQQGSLPPSVVGKDQKGKLLTLKAGGKSVEELTEYCKELSRKEAMGESSDSDGEGGSGCGSHVAPVIHHPFQIKERPTPGMIGIGIRSSLPPTNAIMDKPSDQSKLRMQFPVSSGQEHRKTESDSPLAICYHEEAEIVEDADSTSGDVPEEKEKIIIDPKDQVFPDYSNCEQNMDIGSIVSQRLTALRKLQENPDDLDALNEMTQAQKDMQVWAESKSQPGLFTGSTGAKVLSAAELASGSQAWARKDQLKCATPLTGGMGMLLLQKMGWRPGEGLGKNKEGVLEPLKLDVKTDKRGLVSQEELHRHTNVHRRGHVARSHPRHSFGKHPVSVLVEICSKRRWKVPHFQLVFESGPDHKKSFLFKAIVNGVEYQPPAPSPNKKQAKAHAASICLQAIGVYPPSMNYEGACI